MESQELTNNSVTIEKMSAELDGVGASARSGESIRVVCKDIGTDTMFPVRAHMFLQSTQNEVRAGAVRVFDREFRCCVINCTWSVTTTAKRV